MCPVYMQGIGQMTPAQQTVIRQANNGARRTNGNGTRRRKNGKKASSSGGAKRKATSGSKRSGKSSKPKRLVKGSAEAKRYMAKIRKMRK